MTKLKTHSGAAKRFKRTASGGYKRRRAYRNHILTKMKTSVKRHLRVARRTVKRCDIKAVARMLRGG